MHNMLLLFARALNVTQMLICRVERSSVVLYRFRLRRILLSASAS